MFTHSLQQGPCEKRPKRHRLKAVEWGLAVDNALFSVLGIGLEKFDITAAAASGSDPYTWSSLSLAPDQGSDGMAFLNCLLHKGFGKLMNIEAMCRPARMYHPGTIPVERMKNKKGQFNI
jgi:hypothetical protein